MIVEVSPKITAKADKTIEMAGKVITPGFINSESSLGITEISGGADANEMSSKDKSFSAAFNTADILNPYSIAVPIARRGGVSTVIVAPRSNGDNHFAGLATQFTLTDSQNEVLNTEGIAEFWDFKAIAEGRGATITRFKEELADATSFAENNDVFYKGRLKSRSWSLYDLKALEPIVKGERVLALRVERATDIRAVLRILKGTKIKAVLVGVAEGWMVAKDIAASGVSVVVDTTENLPSDFDVVNASNENVRVLYEAGVNIVIGGAGSAHDTGKIRYFAGMSVANGLPYDAAIAGLTANAAKAWGLKDVGSIQKGMRADLAVWDGDPLEPLSLLTALYIQGESQSLVTRQDRLEQKYIPQATNVYQK
ncbi:amidohydrolase family protein [Shewanella avicenniae]|uniref:Amidohydrolase family protein n=1 Tax=Shewanella avicenniae TaxID=2814294 RepID=A0ABX7QNQ9_9GAMM|nr:amidohydrolase family protein [Shewanella avicenniae]QSX32576.1 amidohydrolase family protein [Shewanella avicenniae]